jgi:hypothetical protein
MWNTTCAHCHRILMKDHLKEIMKCECGWTWGDSSILDRRTRERQRPPDLTLSDHFSEVN